MRSISSFSIFHRSLLNSFYAWFIPSASLNCEWFAVHRLFLVQLYYLQSALLPFSIHRFKRIRIVLARFTIPLSFFCCFSHSNCLLTPLYRCLLTSDFYIPCQLPPWRFITTALFFKKYFIFTIYISVRVMRESARDVWWTLLRWQGTRSLNAWFRNYRMFFLLNIY